MPLVLALCATNLPPLSFLLYLHVLKSSCLLVERFLRTPPLLHVDVHCRGERYKMNNAVTIRWLLFTGEHQLWLR